jgi:hypothetical protein
MKHYLRKWKLDLILKQNPTWQDLYDIITLGSSPRARAEGDLGRT